MSHSIHERNLSLTAKGKTKESVHWQLGWWDLAHSLEGTRRPIQWSKSSVVYTAHESEARIVGRHVPSSRQFLLTPLFPFPMDSYEPPTVISLCPSDDLLYAYFPGRSCDSFGCIWKREAQLDSWSVMDSWKHTIGGGVVTAMWSCPHREWIVTDTGVATRLPPLGPLTPVGTPHLMLVTQSHQLHLYNIISGKAQQVGRVPLLQPIVPQNPSIEPNSVGKIGGDKICVKAAIGLCYQDTTVLIAMRSQLLPSQHSYRQNSMDLGLPMDLGQDIPTGGEWELWGEEPMISLCEVRVEYRSNTPPVLSHPLPPIFHAGSLVDLAFYAPPPARPTSPVTPKTGVKPPTPNGHALVLAATFYDPEDYTSLPKSEIVSYTFLAGLRPAVYWDLKGENRRQGQNKIPSFVLPSISRGGFVAGFLDAGGLLPRRRSKSMEAYTYTGSIEVLKFPDLSAHEDWETVPIRAHVQAGTIDVPISVAISPNETLLCSISSPLLGSHQSIQVLPRRVSGDTSLALTGHLRGDLSKHLIAAIHARYSPSDVIHALAMPTLPMGVVVSTLDKTLTSMEADSFGLMEVWTAELLGVATEVYSARTQRLERGPERDICARRWKTAHEIASLTACGGAFDACREGDLYDLDAVWQLLGMTSWVIDFIEKLFKECIFVGERPEQPYSENETTLESPVFLHIAHPFALSRLLTTVEHVKRFHDQVAKLTAKGEHSHIAKEYLMDITEGSGVDLQLVCPFFAEVLQESKTLNAQHLRRSLASCSPVAELKPHIRKVIDKVLTSKAINRPRLFIKPSDLSDAMSRMSLSDPSPMATSTTSKDKNTDVVKKSALLRSKAVSVCVRCGGRSDVATDKKMGPETLLSRWQTWEKTWQTRCVCGGSWSGAMYA